MPPKKSHHAELLIRNGLEIQKAREIRGLSREALADKSGLHINSIGAIERGERDVSSISQTYIFAALGCNTIHITPECDEIILTDTYINYSRQDVFSLKDSEIIMFIGKLLRLRRIEKKLDMSEVAKKAGVHLNTLWNIENGLVICSGANLHYLYLALNIQWIDASEKGLVFR